MTASQLALVVDAPVARVVVMEDRAQVERRGSIDIPGGLARLEVPALSLAAVDRSLKCEVQGARLVDAKIVRRWREKPKGGLAADASEARRRERALEGELAARTDALDRLVTRRDVLAAARADLLRAIAESAGFGRTDAAAWTEQLESLSAEQGRNDEALRGARIELDRAENLLAEVQSLLARAEQPDPDLECTLALTVESDGPARASIRAAYLVPCAVWRPAYRATLTREDGARSEVTLECEAVVWQRTGERWDDAELAFSTARPTLGTSPPTLSPDKIATRPKAAEEKRVVQVSLREQEIQTAGESSSASADLPGLDDGGEARLLRAPGRATIPSDGQPHRIPLFRFTAPAETELVCPAELTPIVSLVARFTNAGSEVLLAGPVDLVRRSGYVGRAQLKFTAPGETLKLSFGSEDGLRVVRSVDEERDESRLTGRRTTKRRVHLHVSNASPNAARLVIEERVPVSEVKEVEVEVLAKESAPAPANVSKEGIARLPIELQAGGTDRAHFVYQLSAAGKVAGI